MGTSEDRGDRTSNSTGARRTPTGRTKAATTVALVSLLATGVAHAGEAALPPAPEPEPQSPPGAPAATSASQPAAYPPSPSGPPPPMNDARATPPPPPPPPQVTGGPVTPTTIEEPPPERDIVTHPLFGLNAAVGAVFGGDNLLTATYEDGSTQNLPAGRGAVFSLGAMATPLWAGRVGFGLGTDIGVKFTSISASNGSAYLTRFPLVISAHALFDVGAHWYVLAAGGLDHEFGVHLSGDGIFDSLSADLDSSWGGMGEVGAYYAKRRLGASGTLRYTNVHYTFGGQSFAATNIGVFAAIHYNLL